MIAQIAISTAVYAIDKPYDYQADDALSLQPGMRVRVPFGKANRPVEGMTLSVRDENSESLKSVFERMDETPVLTQKMLHTAAFLRERYFCTFYEALKVILPAGLWLRVRETYTAASLPDDWQKQLARKKDAIGILQAISERGSCEYSALQALFPQADDLRELLQYLVKKKLITAQTDLLRKNSDKTEKIAALACSAEEAAAYAAQRKKSAPMQHAVLMLLATVGSACVKEILYFTGANLATVNRLEKLGYLEIQRQEVLRRHEIIASKENTEFVLNREQQCVFDGLYAQQQAEKPGAALLYGVTGSGKTAIYVNLIRACLQQNKAAMLLVPEIALTPQLLSLFVACFGDEVAVLHSSLRVSERYDEWKRIKSGSARVIIGTRSAVFAPTEQLGIIILDEEQEHTYKSGNAPRYHAREVALYRGATERALVLLGSATPSVESMYRAKRGIFTLYTLQNRFNGRQLPAVEIADMKQQLRDGNGTCISAPLFDGIQENMKNGQKTILLLNRRGSNPLTVCVDCGYVPECPNCSVNLIYHMANRRLMCHHCGYSQPYRERCPQCGGHFKQLGSGTQRVQQELAELLPEAQVLRMDADTVTAANPHEKILSQFETQPYDVLLGTQMVAKGLNFPSVTLVGVLDADMSLYLDNFRAAETTFSLITQVIGRAGRADKPGRAFIQTMTPKNAVLQLAAQQDYDAFYEMEIGLRRLKNCPPFYDLLTVGFSGFPEQQVIDAAQMFRTRFMQMLRAPDYATEKTILLGPAPAAITKVNNRFRYRLTLCCENSRKMRELLAFLLRAFAQDKHTKGVTAYADVNGYD